MAGGVQQSVLYTRKVTNAWAMRVYAVVPSKSVNMPWAWVGGVNIKGVKQG